MVYPERTHSVMPVSKDDNKPTKETLSSMIINQLAQLSGQMASSAKELARAGATMSSLWGDGWVKDILFKTMEPQRLQAMADAGHFLHDARKVAGLNLAEMADALGLDIASLEEIERGDKLLPFEGIFRAASLIARHDPIPFIVKFLRTYNPALEEKLEAWGLAAIPKQYERERRFLNLYRKHDNLRALSDVEFERIIGYSDNMISLALDIMAKEKAVAEQQLQQLQLRHSEALRLEREKKLVRKRSKTRKKTTAAAKAKSGIARKTSKPTRAKPSKTS